MTSKLAMIEREPQVSIGLLSGIEAVSFELRCDFLTSDRERLLAGSYQAKVVSNSIEIFDAGGQRCLKASEFQLRPVDSTSSFIIRDITIGIDFHWQRKEDQAFRGALRLKLDTDKRLVVINEISVEAYLTSVISSEMSASSHPELLKAHTIISRSWLLAQIKPWKKPRNKTQPPSGVNGNFKQLIRWYDQENHSEFDVCQDDHCQRYQGITKAHSATVFEAVSATCGQVLTYGGELCDTRYSKSCGGMTESYDAAWEDVKIPYLAASYDGESFPSEYRLPLTDEANADAWIRRHPPAFCNTADQIVLSKILPDFDQETIDFYRWRVTIGQDELRELLRKKLDIDFGAISKLEPVERGASGRLVRLRIVGEYETLVIGKELEIRRSFSPSHLYSSAFIVETDGNRSGVPAQFTLIGAGWGHGVGMCQIGAALMSERGYDHQRILAHYYPGAQLQKLFAGTE